MYNPTVRIIIGILSLVLAWHFYSSGNIVSTYIVLLALGLIIWGYFKSGTVYLAFKELKKENFDKAEKYLSKIRNPHHLKKSQRSYYHFTKGFIEFNNKNLDKSFIEFTNALKLGLRTENDTSIVNFNLASIEYERNNLIEAQFFLNQTRLFNHKKELDAEIERLELKINAAQHRV